MRLASLRPPLARLAAAALVVLATGLAAAPAARAQTFGGALVLNGTTAGAEVAHRPVLNVGSFTVEAWIKPSAAPSGLVSIVSKGPSTVAGRGEYELLLDASLRPVARIRTGSGATTAFTGSVAVAVGAWTHVAMVYEGSLLTLYVNAQAAGATASAGVPEGGATVLRIGAAAAGGAGRFAGQIDEVRLWNAGRSAAQLGAARSVQASGSETGLVGAWSFNAADDLGAGAPGRNDARDAGPSGLHADLVGGAAIGTSTAPIRAMTATLDAFEDRVEVRWSAATPASATVRVRRNQQLLTTLPATATAFSDPTGVAGERYTYCVALVSGGGDASFGCEAGRRSLRPPTDVAASDGTLTDRVRVTWTDRSAVETGYRVYRDGDLLTPTPLAANTVRFDDTAAPDVAARTYCVEPVQGDGAGARACDAGRRGGLLPVATVAASDGAWPGFTRVAWTMPAGPPATAVVLLRNDVRIDTLAGTATETRDYDGAAGTVYRYCVVRIEGAGEAVPVCDAGGHATMRAAETVAATDDAHDDRVEVTWRDAATGETGYRVTRQVGAALGFGGSGYVVVPASDALGLTGTPFTFETWMRIDTHVNGNVLVAKGGAYEIGVGANGFAYFSAASGSFRRQSTAPVSLGAWHHLAVMYDGATLRFTLNGADAGGGALAVVLAPVADAVSIGAGNGLRMRGALDEMRLWGRARTAAQVQAGMFAAASGRETDLLARWSFDDGVGAVVLDGAGGHHGAFSGTGLAWSAPEAPLAAFGQTPALAPGAGGAAAAVPFSGTGDFTVALWARPVLPQAEAVLVGGDGPALSVTASGALRVRLTAADGTATSHLLPGYFAGGGSEWVHLAWVKSGPALLVYRNGVRVDSLGGVAGAYRAGTTFGIGTGLGGAIDEVEVSRVARSAADLRALLATPRAATAAGLDALWRFDSADGSRVTRDASPAARHATLGAGAALTAGRPALLAALPAGTTGITDRSAAPGVSARYCVAAATSGGVETPLACDDGRRGSVITLAMLAATEGTHENRVALAWPTPGSRTTYVAVYRDSTTLIATLPAARTSYDDLRGTPGTRHRYCVALGSPEGIESTRTCATGWRELRAPGAVAASDNSAEHEVALTWTDASEAETGYRVLRAPATPTALALSGSAYASVRRAAALDLVTGLTVEAWVRPSSLPAAGQAIVAKTESGRVGYVLAIDGQGRPTFTVRTATATAPSALPTGAWTHVAATFDGATRTMRLVVGGAQVATATTPDDQTQANASDLTLGADLAAGGRYFQGQIDEVRLWTGARSPAAIAAARTATVAAGTPGATGLVAAWSFDEDGGIVAGDASGGGALALLTGGATRAATTGLSLDPALLRTTPPSVGAHTDRTGAPGVRYRYSVAAIDSLGASATGTDTGARTLRAPLRLRAGDGTAETAVEMTWEDASGSETGFRVFRAPAGTQAWALAATPARNVGSHADTGLSPGARLQYAVVAHDLYGASDAAADTASTVLLPPLSLAASVTYTDRVTLAWADASGVETGYRVFRGGTLLTATPLAAGTTAYTDAAATAGAAATYCVATVSGTAESARACASGLRAGAPVVAVGGGTLETLLTASDAKANAGFGRAVAIDGDYAVVGAPFHNPDGSGPREHTGAAYVFRRENGRWVQQQRLLASDGSGFDYFGLSVAIHGDYVAVGGYNIGSFDAQQAAYVFKRTGTTWEQIHRFTADAAVQRSYGISVALSDAHLFVGAASESQGGVASGVVYAYRLDGGAFTFLQKLRPTSPVADQRFGRSLAAEGTRLVVGGPGIGSTSGRVFVFEKSGSTFAQTADILRTTSMGFGWSVALDGDAFAAGNPTNGTTGTAYVYRRGAGGTWAQETFNASGAVNELFVRPESYDALPVARFGTAIDLRDGRLLVGAEGNTDSSTGTTGSAHLFERQSDGVWRPVRRLGAANAASTSQYGRAVALGTETLVFGGPGADNTSTGGAVALAELSQAPGGVTASDGVYEGRVQVRWDDRSTREENFVVYRNGQKIGETGPDERSFDDFDAPAGDAGEYCVASFRAIAGESPRVCDRGWRPANGTIAGRVASSAGAGVDGVAVCLAPSPNQALLFDGTGGRVATGRTSAEMGLVGASFTVEAWVRPTANRGGTSDLGVLGGDGGGTGELLHLGLRSGAPYFGFGGSDLPSAAVLPLGQWRHVAWVYDQSAQRQTMYVDGAQIATRTGAAPLSGSSPVFIGWYGANTNSYFQGGLDDVRIWSRARTGSEIAAAFRAPLTGRETSLTAYYAADQGAGRGLLDATPNGFHGGLQNNVAWTQQSGPLDVCARTDRDGNYRLAALPYGASRTFEVRPALGGRTFQPAARTVTLSAESPVENAAEFTDASSFAASGLVTFAGTTCPVPDVSIDVDNKEAVRTGADGAFSTALLPRADAYQLRARLAGRSFTPPLRSIAVAGDVPNLAFADTTTRAVTLRVTGGCNVGLGAATVEITTENACVSRTVTTSAAGVLTLRLPPQAYSARVTALPNAPAFLRADAERYFQDLGALAFDLTARDTTLALQYHAPLRIALDGAPANACSLLPVPLVAQGEALRLRYRIFEDYGPAGQCAVDSARVSITDEVADAAHIGVVATARGGVLRYTGFGGLPDLATGRIVDGIDRSHQKSITAVAEAGLRRATTSDWFVVTGKRPRAGSQFVTEVTTDVPLLVLHDPPGDGSTAFVEKGWTFCKNVGGAGYDVLDIDFAGGFYANSSSDAGLILSTKIHSLEAHVGAYARVSLEKGSDDNTQICVTPTERISTSSDGGFVGADADVFVGAGLNAIFATTDVLGLDTRSCTFEQSETVTFSPKKIETSTVYTRAHIRDVLIPQLDDLAANPSAALPGTDFTASARRWRKQLSFADSLGRLATAAFDTVRTGTPRANVSFSGGTTYEFSREIATDSTKGWMQDYTATAGFKGDVAFSIAGLGGFFELEIGGGRHTITRRDSTLTNRRLTGYTLSDDDAGDAYSVNVRLDPYSKTPVFDVLSGRSSCPFEPWMAAPLVTADGAAPAALAPRMTTRDLGIVRVTGSPVRSGIPYNEPATFGLALQNLSPTKEDRTYVLRALHENNPGGATMNANGGSLFAGQRYVLPYARTQEVLVSVGRGPTRYNYDSLAVVLTPACEDGDVRDSGADQASLAYLSVRFEGGCSPVNLRGDTWAVTRASNGRHEPFFDGFTLVPTDAGQRLKRLGLEYRRKGDADWKTAGLSPAASREGLIGLRPGAPLDQLTAHIDAWDVPPILPDGDYELRALAQCERPDPQNPAVYISGGLSYSAVRAGRIDRKRPEVLTTPQPAGGVLALGGDIAVTFDEPVRCESVRTDSLPGIAPNAVLRVRGGAVVPARAVCDGRTVVLVATGEGALGALEGRRLNATLRAFVGANGAPLTSADGRALGLADVAGNPLAADVAWSFVVRRSAFAWATTEATVPARLGERASVTVPLGNGRPEAVDFTVEGAPAWLVPSVLAGRLSPGATLPVAFAIADSVEGGTRIARIVARSATSTDTLTIRVEIGAEATWAVTPADFARTMSATFQVAIDGPTVRHAGVRVAAFVGGQVRGVAPVTPLDTDGDGTMDGNRALLTIHGNTDGEAVTFKVWDGAARRLYATTNRTLTFEGDAVHGTPVQPLLLRAPRLVDASAIALSAGWTWVSFNRRPAGPAAFTPTTVFASLGARAGDVVKGQTAFSMYDPAAGWAGTLTAFDATRAYLVRMSRSDELVLGGIPVDPAATPVALGAGWNWLGYLPQAPLAVGDALAALAATTGDVVKSQTAFAQYVSGAGWVGSLATLDPGKGYLVRLAAAATFTYPNAAPPGPAATLASADAAADGDAGTDASITTGGAAAATRPSWTVNAAAFEHSMSVVAEARLASGPASVGALVGAFDATGAVRGVASVQAAGGRLLAFLTAYGAPGETLAFRVWDPAADSVHAATTTLAFAPNGIAGSVAAPFAVRTASATAIAGEPLPLALTLERNRPNPFAGTTTIRFGLPEAGHVRVVVFDLMGREVARLADRAMEPGWHTVALDGATLPSGVYVYRLQAGRDVRTARMVVAR